MTGTSPKLRAAVNAARKATDEFVAWLEKLAPTKTGPSGVGKEKYTWYQQNVHFIPYNWNEEVVLLRRELERAQSTLRLEEHHNRNLPPLEPATDAAAFHDRLDKFVDFLIKQEIIPAEPLITTGAEKLGHIPSGESDGVPHPRHDRSPCCFFPTTITGLIWDGCGTNRIQVRFAVRPCSRNIWDNRAEGFATAFEELVMHVGLYDDNPRARELVWIMLANRAPRGLASLYAQANLFTLELAGRFHS